MRALVAPEHVEQVETDGFTIIRDALSAAEVEPLRRTLARLAAQQHAAVTDMTAIDDYMVHNLMLLDDGFLELLENPSIVSALDTFLSDTSIVYAYTSSSMPAGGSNYSHRVHNDSPRIIPGYLTNLGIIVALDDFTDDNGATYFLPGSFTRADRPSDEEFFAEAVRVHPRAGDLVVFNACTWHLGGTNHTGSERHAATINAVRSFMRQRFDYPRMIPAERIPTLTPTLRRLLGFNVRVPTSLDEYYVPADQRLYLANQG
jgi:ectoine hydroxylase-related dioxygenase (phytanoyl-CoA dioxygenase family)